MPVGNDLLVVSYCINEHAVEKAKRLIESRQYVLNSGCEWAQLGSNQRPPCVKQARRFAVHRPQRFAPDAIAT